MTESKWKPNNKLTRKQNAFVKYLVDNPKASGAKAVRETYDVTTDGRQQAVDNMSNPVILSELAKHSGNAELTLIRLMSTSEKFAETGSGAGAQYAGVTERIANSILDRLHGKATQRIEQQTSSVNINIGLDI